MEQPRPWAILLVLFDVVHWSIGGLLFGRVVEE
jgi:hypothetical protein